MMVVCDVNTHANVLTQRWIVVSPLAFWDTNIISLTHSHTHRERGKGRGTERGRGREKERKR